MSVKSGMTLAKYIEKDLGERVRRRRGLPEPLTLAGLAEHYQVSVTPVRQAVDSLVAQGVLRKGDNRRLVPGPRARGRATQGTRRRTVRLPESAEATTRRIREDLVRASLRGRARFLREEASAKRYGISRSALRNVFHQLAGQGLLEHVPRRGWRLRPFRQDDMQAFLEVRESLELKALELARDRLDPDRLERILAGNRMPRSSTDAPRVDNSLHAYIIECAGNPYICDFFERHAPYYDLLFEWEDLDREAALETVRQHRGIIVALLAGRWSIASEELVRHIRDNHPVLTRIGKGR